MSRRKGQQVKIEQHGANYTVRVRADIEGQKKRIFRRVNISPVSRRALGWLNSKEREFKAREIVGKQDADNKKIVGAGDTPASRQITFAEQSRFYMEKLRKREKPAAAGSLDSFQSHLKNWVNPMLGNLPLRSVGNGALKKLVSWMKTGGPMPPMADKDGNGNENGNDK